MAAMDKFMDRISSYDLFNYLFPGTLFVVLVEKFTHYSLVQPDLVTGVFLYYFIGLVISRLGSLLLEPLLKLVRFLRFAPYKDFIAAAGKNEKIEVLSEVNNTYRTLCTMFIALLALKAYELHGIGFTLQPWMRSYGLLLALLLVFLTSYKKQTGYVRRRVEAVLK